jgi:glycosyltransferase involved in cell wall biosynthesis
LGADAVFTLFGPAYVRFDAPHLCGVADGWITHAGRVAYSQLGSWQRKVEALLRMGYKGYWYRQANAWVVEADVARRGLIRRWRVRPDKVFVVPNTCGDGYFAVKSEMRRPGPGERLRIGCLSAYYVHKNLELIPEVARALRAVRPALDFEFVLTLPGECEGWREIERRATSAGVSRYIRNVGPVRVADGPAFYEACHMVFLPTVLETFSANYPEAMAMKRPMVTTDLPFARDACGDAAEYFEPLNPHGAAAGILLLVDSEKRWRELVLAGERRLAALPRSAERLSLYEGCLRTMLHDRGRSSPA